MHFSVLIPVQVNIQDQDHERVKAAALRHAILTELLSGTNPQDISRKVSLEVEDKYCAALHNAFASAVDTAVDEAMAPYSQDTEDPKYCIFEDETESLKAQFETDTIECIQYGTKYYGKRDIPGFKVCNDGVVREVTESGQEFLSAKAQQMRVVTIPVKEFYKTFRKYANQYASYNKEKKAWGYYTNPNCFYDWYSIGGRWQAPFLVKEECEDYAEGVCGAGGDGSLPEAPEGYKWTSAARIKDLQIDAMVQHSIDEFTERYRKYEKMWDAQAIVNEKGYYLELKADGIYSFGRKVFDPNVSLEDALKEQNYTVKNALSRMLYAYLDTRIAMEPDEYGELPSGYYEEGCVDGEWQDVINNFIAEFNPETVLVMVDCHM